MATSRRVLIGALLAGSGLLALGVSVPYLLGGVLRRPGGGPTSGPMGGGMMGGATSADMNSYMFLFGRHAEIRRSVDEIPGGVRTTTESDDPALTARLQEHVASMYGHVDQGREVRCMSDSLPLLFRHGGDYRRQLTVTPRGVTATETSGDPELVAAIRAHAREVSGFVRDGMPAMMRGMMGGSPTPG